MPDGTVAVLSILDDKDAAAMLRVLAPAAAACVHRAPNPRALPPATLASLASQLGIAGEIEPDPRPRSRAPASSPVPAARSSPPARSTWLPTSLRAGREEASAL